ncbi:MAG: diacylglycerol kinase family protein [Crocinitomicaceae bacterium]|nr:diacylglycerol kinase family protein [Crocinitomicaceae bacterium]
MKFFRGFKFAFKGIYEAFRSGLNFKVHVLALFTVIISGYYFNITTTEWSIILLTSALVLSLEAMNSAIEQICNEITEERKESIRIIKDMAAGAVLISSAIAIVIAGLIFGKYLFIT